MAVYMQYLNSAGKYLIYKSSRNRLNYHTTRESIEIDFICTGIVNPEATNNAYKYFIFVIA